MEAQIFYLKSQQALCNNITSLLREYVYDDIQVNRLVISNLNPVRGGDVPQQQIARSYLNLLKSTMIKVGDFQIGVEDPSGDYWYMGYGGKFYLKLSRQLMTSVFPAVAVMDRMVMLPQGIHKAFDSPSGFSFFPRPLDLQGVLLVDFDDQRAIREGVQQVAAQVETEVTKLCRQYMSVNMLPQPDFDDLAKLLNIDRNYFEQYQDDIFARSVKLTPKIVSGPAQRAIRSQVVLEIQNESEDELGVVCVQVKAPADALTAPVVEYLDFSAGKEQTQKIQFEVCPRAPRFCPLAILFMPSDTSQTYTPFPIPLTLDVVEK